MEQQETNEFAPYECEEAQWVSTPFALQYAALKGAIEASMKAIEDRRPGAPSEITDLQRRAVASLEGCVIAILRVRDALEGGSFDAQTSQFLDCARRLALALSDRREAERPVRRERARGAPTPPDKFRERLASLTPKQLRALDLLLTGLPNKLIAHELGIAETTVKAHIGAVIRKLEVRNRSQVIVAAARLERREGFSFAAGPIPESANPRERAGAEFAGAKRAGGLR